MHFLRLLCPPFSFHQHTQSIISSHLLTQISAFIFTPAFTHVKFLQGFVKPRPPPPKKKERAWSWAKKKFPTEDELVLPVKHHWQSRHYKPNIHPQLVERWCIFRVELGSPRPPNPPLLYTASEDVPLFLQLKENERFFFAHISSVLHYARV